MGTYGDMLGEQLGSQAAGGALGGIMDMVFQPWRNANQLKQSRALQEQQIQAQKQMGQFNYDQQLKMWNATNSEAQMKHLKDAGLNPGLMYGGGGQGGTTTGNVTAGNVGGGMGDPKAGGGYTGMNIMQPAQIRLMEAQARNLDADTAKKSGIDTTLAQTENKLKSLDLKVNEETLDYKIAQILAEYQRVSAEAGISHTNMEIGQETQAANIQRIKAEAINAILMQQVMKQGIKLSQAQVNKLSADIAQKGRELDINQFIAETKANQPGIGEIIGSLILPIADRVKKLSEINDKRKVR